MVGSYRNDRSPHGEELDHVRAPTVAALVQLYADDAFSLSLLRFRLHPFHGELTCIVQRLCVIGHFLILPYLFEPTTESLVRDMIDTAPHHHADRPVAGCKKGPEILTG